MKFISTKQTLTTLAVFLTILFLGSCGLADDTAPPGGEPTAFQQDIENATTVPNLTLANALTREVLQPLNVATGTPLEKRYVTETGGGSYDGTSWGNAWAATNLRNGINTITDATANKVYLVMVAGGTYKPDYSTTVNRTISFSMTNHVAIMGGFQTGGGWGRTGTTMFSGDIGDAGNTDNSYHVFSHDTLTLSNAHLYGVTITGGNANGSFTQLDGGGMFNRSSSPVLTEVVFSGNTAVTNGGGMFNNNSSSPVLTRVVFSGNNADGGGGMANIFNSSPVLTEVVFRANSVTGNGILGGGGGMFNGNSSPVLTRVVFSGNTSTGVFGGGGMFNDRTSSPVLTNVVFSGNTATADGGGMYNSGASQVLTSVMFSGNTASRGGGMYNRLSSPVLTSVVFSENNATSITFGGGGGGMYNQLSSPVLVGAVFRNNTATNGGGMLNDNDGRLGPLIVNSIFSGNTLSGSSGSGTNIAMRRDGSSVENIRIAGSVLGIGLAQPTNDIVGYGGGAALNISYHNLTNTAVRFGADANLTINGMSFPYPTITAGSSAINLGLYVRKHVNAGATTYHFSETEAVTSWHTSFTSTGAGGLAGAAGNLPTTGTIENLTATDIAGNARNARPDAGVYELP